MVESLALIVPLSAGEEARRLVASRGIGRADLKLGRREGALLIPIREPIDTPIPGARLEHADFEATHPQRSYKDLANVPSDLRESLPTSFDIIGDLVLIKLPAALLPHEAEIGRALLESHPSVHGVFLDEGVEGEWRVRSLRRIAGSAGPATVHTEYGARFHVDLSAAYFSPRLANEHQRVARLVGPDERVLDATAGVGPFTVLGARLQRTSRFLAIDLNPRAIELLRANVALNKVDERVAIHFGDARELAAGLRPFERAIVNLPHAGEPILQALWPLVAAGGTLHHHAVLPEAEAQERADALLSRMSRLTGRAADLVHFRIVHPYSPSERLYSLDFRLR